MEHFYDECKFKDYWLMCFFQAYNTAVCSHYAVSQWLFVTFLTAFCTADNGVITTTIDSLYLIFVVTEVCVKINFLI